MITENSVSLSPLTGEGRGKKGRGKKMRKTACVFSALGIALVLPVAGSTAIAKQSEAAGGPEAGGAAASGPPATG